MTTAIVDASRKILLVNEDPATMLTTAFVPQPKLPNRPKREVLYHLSRANVAFMDGHMESVPAPNFAEMRKFFDLYFNAGR